MLDQTSFPPQVYTRSELGDIVENSDLFARPEGRQADVRAVGAAEGVAQRAAAAAASLALDGEVQLVEVLALELQRAQVAVGLGTACLIFLIEALGQTAGAVFAGAALLAGGGSTLEGCEREGQVSI